jgi:hypothetical protein
MNSIKLKDHMQIVLFVLDGRVTPWAIGAFNDAVRPLTKGEAI